jgi:hypothetical protein
MPLQLPGGTCPKKQVLVSIGHGHCRFRITYCLSAQANWKNSFMAGTSAAPD